MKKIIVWFLALAMLVSAAGGVLAEEDAVTVQVVEKLSDYTARALPMTEDTYNEVVNNVLDQIGTVYCVKGTVAEILDDSTWRMLVYAGEEGESLPVIIEVPATSSYHPQPGEHLTIYAEVLQLLNRKPLLMGRYFYPEEEEAEQVSSVGTDPSTGLTVEEYTRQAWPVTEEEYDKLVNDPESRDGQVYVVEGVVEEIAEDGLQKVKIFAGLDEKSLPVIVSIPATCSYHPQPGERVRIYGEAAAPVNGLPLVEGRYIYELIDMGQE